VAIFLATKVQRHKDSKENVNLLIVYKLNHSFLYATVVKKIMKILHYRHIRIISTRSLEGKEGIY